MKLGFEEFQSPYSSSSQNARAWTEAWVSARTYCPHRGNTRISLKARLKKDKPSFPNGPQDQTQNFEIPGSSLRDAPE
jgi:Dam-replacing family protein